METPMVEYGDMYDRHPLEEINQQTYTFHDSSKGHPMQLRADMTPSLVRAVVANHPKATYPLKWFSIPQCWSHDVSCDVFDDIGNKDKKHDTSMREHYQWNMDVWGVAGVEAEAELLCAAVTALTDMGITYDDVVFKISSRKIANEVMNRIGIGNKLVVDCVSYRTFISTGIHNDNWKSMHILLNKADRMTSDALQHDLQSLGVSRNQFDEVVSILSNNKDIAHFSDKLGPDSEGVKDVRRLLELLDLYGLRQWAQFDASVVRGQAYYSGVVFEAFDRQGQFRAICGGGRYDDMLEPMFRVHGEYPSKAAGFGMSDRAVQALLSRKGLLPSLTAPQVDVALMTTGTEDSERDVYQAVSLLRNVGISVDFLNAGETKSPPRARCVVRVSRVDVVVIDTSTGLHTQLNGMESVAQVVKQVLNEQK